MSSGSRSRRRRHQVKRTALGWCSHSLPCGRKRRDGPRRGTNPLPSRRVHRREMSETWPRRTGSWVSCRGGSRRLPQQSREMKKRRAGSRWGISYARNGARGEGIISARDTASDRWILSAVAGLVLARSTVGRSKRRHRQGWSDDGHRTRERSSVADPEMSRMHFSTRFDPQTRRRRITDPRGNRYLRAKPPRGRRNARERGEGWRGRPGRLTRLTPTTSTPRLSRRRSWINGRVPVGKGRRHRGVRNRKRCTNYFAGWSTGELKGPGATMMSPAAIPPTNKKTRRGKTQTAATTTMSKRRFGRL
mmetsp:Transcript_11243/g.52241  ORF Transcript_11243/g.52241 Transcript_11243/m.52241 type:complete len:305 (-) Transcript_11243:4614-5528(-)